MLHFMQRTSLSKHVGKYKIMGGLMPSVMRNK